MKSIELISGPDITPAQCCQNLRTLLQSEVDVRRRWQRPKSVRYDGIGDFVLRYGVEFEHQERPSEYQPGEPRACFYNCLTGLARYDDCVYVEGYAITPEFPLPVHHAWLTRSWNRKVIELTCDSFRGYIGVAFTRQAISAHIRRIERLDYPQNSILDDFGNSYPVLSAGPRRLGQWLHPGFRPPQIAEKV